jgi:hypothetical protein
LKSRPTRRNRFDKKAGAAHDQTVDKGNNSGGLFAAAAVFADLRNPETRGGYTWLYLTLFSTLLPTGLHLVIGIFSITTWLPMKAKVWIADMMDREDTGSGGSILGGILTPFGGAVWCFAIALLLWEGGSWTVSNIEGTCLAVLSSVEIIASAPGLL